MNEIPHELKDFLPSAKPTPEVKNVNRRGART